jgi:hypothetical protein
MTQCNDRFGWKAEYIDSKISHYISKYDCSWIQHF